MAAYRNYLRGLVASKAEDRADDFASALLGIQDEDPDRLTHEEIASILFSLSFAGHETTNNLLGNTIRRLLEDTRRWEAVVADRSLIPGVVDEVLRYDPSVTVWRRQARRDVTVGDVRIPAGSRLFLWLAAAGRDPSVFPEPDRFDPLRENARRTLTFGKGIHYCIGAALGKLETQVAVDLLADRFPGLRLVAGEEISFHPNIAFRGPMSLRVEVQPVMAPELPVTQDALGTHLEWEHDGITPRMIDWFWSNMEKGFLLWHPQEHAPLSWAVPVRPGNLVGAVHLAPQTWSDGTFRNLYIRFEDPATLAPEIQERIVFEHCVVAAGLGFGPESLEAEEPMGYRVHQWQGPNAGVVGRSSAIAVARAGVAGGGPGLGEALRRGDRQLGGVPPAALRLYRVVERPEHNPFADLSVVHDGGRALPELGVTTYRADVVGSLLRPPDARRRSSGPPERARSIPTEYRRRSRIAAVDDVLRLQEAAGVDVVDGRRDAPLDLLRVLRVGPRRAQPASRAHGAGSTASGPRMGWR